MSEPVPSEKLNLYEASATEVEAAFPGASELIVGGIGGYTPHDFEGGPIFVGPGGVVSRGETALRASAEYEGTEASVDMGKLWSASRELIAQRQREAVAETIAPVVTGAMAEIL